MSRRAAVSVRALSRRLGARDVLKDVSLELGPGDVFVLMGHNGSGKTTLLEILATLLHPSSGGAAILGHDVVKDGAAARALLGYAPSSLQSFYPRLTALRNLEFFGALYGVGPRELRRRALYLLDRLSLREAARERVERFSDGMKARLSLARALLTDAPVLLLDEPTKSLDAEGRETARHLVVDDSRGKRTVVWVTHDESEARALSANVGHLEAGTLR